ncbi:MAG: hypothetical protein C0402_04100 [Thermodesulfovibrio sp.]|nr:hypothetical protein [Thermodesulfovibrio sp.]
MRYSSVIMLQNTIKSFTYHTVITTISILTGRATVMALIRGHSAVSPGRSLYSVPDDYLGPPDYDIIIPGGLSMNNIWLIIIAVVLGAVAAYLIPLLIELRRTVEALRNTVERNLNPALDELQKNLRTLNSVTGNVEQVTENIKIFSRAVGDVGRSVGAFNALVSSTGASTAIRMMSLRTGVTAAVGFILTNLLKRGDRR